MNWLDKNTEVYNNGAADFAAYFGSKGPQTKYIEMALELAGSPADVKVLELGCGDGRDANEILKRVDSYVGIDPSSEFIKIAQQQNPGASFIVSDALSYNYPKNLDVIYAFASLLHVDKHDLAKVFEKAGQALRPAGIFFLALKERPGS